MSEKPIIEVKGLWKRYGLPPFLPWKKQHVADHEWALRDINFTLPRGGSLGILGRNGAGKSTLLKVLAGVTPPDKGTVNVYGRIFPMIELTAGMSMELSGRENIAILGTMMGLSRTEIQAVAAKVEDFSELGDWLLRPVWQYSSGMVSRLAFGIALYVQAELLIVDEALSVGDIMFQKKCLNAIYAMLEQGVSLLFVSHSPAAITRICTDGMLLESGKMLYYGTSMETLDEYYATLGIAGKTTRKLLPEDQRQGSGDMRVTSIEFLDSKGNVIDAPITGAAATFKINYTAKTPIRGYGIALVIKNSRDEILLFLNSAKADLGPLPQGNGAILCTVPALPLLEKGLVLTVKVKGDIVFDIVENAVTFDMVIPKGALIADARAGVIWCEQAWTIDKSTQGQP
ncbi:ABC transporter ATP-binding protein [Desulfovibrio desulfuricans]|nr:ABC transporter ATP-binding protein [Desulfovibrio desulfuricans]MBD8894688.1 ABC transporter ATP-binding protein [Desulfovibrio desulfuricans]UIA99195.1 ABC transporter ATP-binding protein [Desulfovibrio desulfuricans]SBV92336.1 putative ABC transporter related protein [uncultured Desulfovibrio sp.]